MHIYLFGNLNSGKSTLSKKVSQSFFFIKSQQNYKQVKCWNVLSLNQLIIGFGWY